MHRFWSPAEPVGLLNSQSVTLSCPRLGRGVKESCRPDQREGTIETRRTNGRMPLGSPKRTMAAARICERAETCTTTYSSCLGWLGSGNEGDMGTDYTDRAWCHVEEEWQRVMRGLRDAAIRSFASDGDLSEEEIDFYRIVLRQTVR